MPHRSPNNFVKIQVGQTGNWAVYESCPRSPSQAITWNQYSHAEQHDYSRQEVEVGYDSHLAGGEKCIMRGNIHPKECKPADNGGKHQRKLVGKGPSYPGGENATPENNKG